MSDNVNVLTQDDLNKMLQGAAKEAVQEVLATQKAEAEKKAKEEADKLTLQAKIKEEAEKLAKEKIAEELAKLEALKPKEEIKIIEAKKEEGKVVAQEEQPKPVVYNLSSVGTDPIQDRKEVEVLSQSAKSITNTLERTDKRTNFIILTNKEINAITQINESRVLSQSARITTAKPEHEQLLDPKIGKVVLRNEVTNPFVDGLGALPGVPTTETGGRAKIIQYEVEKRQDNIDGVKFSEQGERNFRIDNPSTFTTNVEYAKFSKHSAFTIFDDSDYQAFTTDLSNANVLPSIIGFFQRRFGAYLGNKVFWQPAPQKDQEKRSDIGLFTIANNTALAAQRGLPTEVISNSANGASILESLTYANHNIHAAYRPSGFQKVYLPLAVVRYLGRKLIGSEITGNLHASQVSPTEGVIIGLLGKGFQIVEVENKFFSPTQRSDGLDIVNSNGLVNGAIIGVVGNPANLGGKAIVDGEIWHTRNIYSDMDTGMSEADAEKYGRMYVESRPYLAYTASAAFALYRCESVCVLKASA